jgi:Zn-dependent protease with chaperone function
MRLLPVLLVIAAAGALATSLALWLTRGTWLKALDRLEPARRARWLQAALAAPVFGALGVVLFSFEPCLGTLLRGVPDSCQAHGRPTFALCLHMPERAHAGVYALAILGLLPLSVRALRLGYGALRTRAALAMLRRLGRYDDAWGAWIVPGPLAAVGGWPRGVVYLGEALFQRFPTATIAIVRAHERAHVERADILRKASASLLASFHFPPLARELLDGLDLAMEQACDAAAAAEVRDPMRVAEALVDLARHAHAAVTPALAMSLSLDRHLELRVAALCEPSWSTTSSLPKHLVVACCLIAAALVLDDAIHHDAIHEAVETAFAAFSR